MFFQAARLGAAVPASVLRLQNAVIALGRRKNDPALMIAADGVVGTKTVNAVRRALIVYVVGGTGSAPSNWGRTLTTSTLAANANEIAPYIERAAGISPEMLSAQAAGQAASQASMLPFHAFPTPSAPAVSPGGHPVPYPQQQPYYAPQQQMYSPGYAPMQPRGPGGLPTDRATLDVKAFIPAQYQHVSISPFVGIALIVGTLAVIGMVKRHKIVEK